MNLPDQIMLDILSLSDNRSLFLLSLINSRILILNKDKSILEKVFNSINKDKKLKFFHLRNVIHDYSDIQPVSKVARFMNGMYRTVLDNLEIISQNIISPSSMLYLDKYVVDIDNPIFLKLVEKVKESEYSNTALVKIQMLDYLMTLIVNEKNYYK